LGPKQGVVGGGVGGGGGVCWVPRGSVTTIVPMMEGLDTGVLCFPSVWTSCWSFVVVEVLAECVRKLVELVGHVGGA
jgi:hypothetical protein